MSPFLICLSPPDRRTDRLYERVDGLDGWIWSNGQTDRLIGWTDGHTKQTNVQMEGRTEGRPTDRRTGQSVQTD